VGREESLLQYGHHSQQGEALDRRVKLLQPGFPGAAVHNGFTSDRYSTYRFFLGKLKVIFSNGYGFLCYLAFEFGKYSERGKLCPG
jgi:hypothetical protein